MTSVSLNVISDTRDIGNFNDSRSVELNVGVEGDERCLRSS